SVPSRFLHLIKQTRGPPYCHSGAARHIIVHYVLFSYIPDTEAESSHLVFSEAYCLDNIAESKNILYFIYSVLCNLGNVYKSLFARCKLEECSEIFNADNLSLEHLSGLKIRDNCMNEFCCLIHPLFLCTADGYGTVIFDIDLNACLFDNGIDRL